MTWMGAPIWNIHYIIMSLRFLIYFDAQFSRRIKTISLEYYQFHVCNMISKTPFIDINVHMQVIAFINPRFQHIFVASHNSKLSSMILLKNFGHFILLFKKMITTSSFNIATYIHKHRYMLK